MKVKVSKTNLFLLVLIVLGISSVVIGEEAEDEVVEYDDDTYEEVPDRLENIMIMPLSCIKYNNEHMIRFQMFEGREDANNGEEEEDNVDICLVEDEEDMLGTFVVPVADYMRAYFNYQVLLKGDRFNIPRNAGHLQCAMVQQTAYSEQPLYGKIGCMEKEAYTTPRLRIHLYTDKDCTEEYDDGRTDSIRGIKGYNIDGSYFNPHVGFRPPFYSCSTCQPQEISYYFSKAGSRWLDDDAAANGQVSYQYFDDWTDDIELMDDTMKVVSQYTNNARVYSKDDDDDFYTTDDSRRERKLVADKEYEEEFYKEIGTVRKLEEAEEEQDDVEAVQEWNMCEQIMKYGSWCNSQCRSLDAYNFNTWSHADYVLLGVISSVMGILMVIIHKKHSYNYRSKLELPENKGCCKAFCYGIPVFLMGAIFVAIIAALGLFTYLNLVNETLLIAIIVCVILFMYVTRLSLYEAKAKKTPLLDTSTASIA